MATLLELAKIKHHAVRSDGAKFLDGERDDSLPTPWLTVSSGRVTLQKGLYDELLVVKGEVTDDQIKAWAAMGAPFYDAAGNIVYEGAGGRIEMDKDGQRFIRSDGQTMIEMDTETGGARFAGDITGSSGTFADGQVAIGDVGGKPWGSGTLPPGTPGIWGDQAGLYLRGYSSFVRQGTVEDEGYVEIGDDQIVNPSLVLSLQQLFVPQSGVTITTNSLYDDENSRFKIQAKIFVPSLSKNLPGHPLARGYVHQVPTSPDPAGVYGRYMNRIVIKASWSVGASAEAYLEIWTNDQFDQNGNPVENGWIRQAVRSYTNVFFGRGRTGQFPDVNISLPANPDYTQKQYALRFVDRSSGFWGSSTRIDSIEYYQDGSYYRFDGTAVAPNAPSGLKVAYTLFQQG